MNWATWQTELPLLFATLLGIPCAWADQPRTMVTGPRAQLRIVSTPSIGTETLRREVVADELIEEAIGFRRMVLQLEVWNASQTLDVAARSYLERARTRLAMTSTQQSLKTLRLSFERCEAPVDLDVVEDGRRISRWAMDVHLAYAWSERDEETPGSWIERGRITANTADDVDGTPLHADLQIDINPPEP